MDHLNAIETQAAERYLLGELPAADAEEFELHYFECGQCALAVESGGLFISAARERFRESPAAQPTAIQPSAETGKPRRTFSEAVAAMLRPGFAIPVMAALAAVVIYQNVMVIPDMQHILTRVRPLPAVLLIGASRGEETPVEVTEGSPFVSVAALVPSGTKFQEYECVVTTGDRETSSSPASAQPEGEPVTLLIPARQLTAGSHELILYGRGPDGRRSDKIAKYPFAVHFNK